MKKIHFILICCISYIVISTAIYYAIDKSIDKKVVRLHSLAIANLNSFFESKPKYVDLFYGPYGCNYKEVHIPSPEEPGFNDVMAYIRMVDSTLTFDEATHRVRQNLKNVWERKYGNYRKMYELDIFPTEDNNTKHSGWALKVICKQPEWTLNDGIQTYFIFPKQVAYKKIAPLLYGGVPSVETAIQEALDFSIKNEKSDLQPYYERGSTYNLISKMESAINNEYYHFTKDPEGSFFYRSNSRDFGNIPSSVESGGMYNGYYEVIYHKTQPISYSIKFIGNEVVQSDKYRLTAIYIGLLTFIMLGVIIMTNKKWGN